MVISSILRQQFKKSLPSTTYTMILKRRKVGKCTQKQVNLLFTSSMSCNFTTNTTTKTAVTKDNNSDTKQKMKNMTFFNMKHSNNAARIRLWLNLKKDFKDSDLIDTKMIGYQDLGTFEFGQINPLGKVPASIRDDGETVFESSVILNYLEDKYSNEYGPSFLPENPEDRQLMNLMIQCYDLYIASPNCTAPNFSHS